MAEDFDLSKALEQAREMLASPEGEARVESLLGMLTQGSSDSQAPQNPPQQDTPGGVDMETLLKIKALMEGMNNTGGQPESNFLQALKPFLKKERREKIDQASKLLSLSKVLKMLKGGG